MGLLGDLLGKGIDVWSQQHAIDKQNQANFELAKYQSQVNEDFYNKYSSPAALMRQYEQAGLNPNLVYGSASAGQSNVPSFSAPHVERGLSGSEKVSSVLGMLGQILGLKQQVYQTDAAREAAEQSGIKTLRDFLGLRSDRIDTEVKSETIGWNGGGLTGRYRNSSLGRRRNAVDVGLNLPDSPLMSYSQAARSKFFNDALRSSLSNAYDFGGAFNVKGQHYQLSPSISPYMESRNLLSGLKYKLTNEIGNMGQYGKLFISLLDLLK